MRLAVVSPFLDQQHGTELCIIEQVERFAWQDHWSIELYSQKVSQLSAVRPASNDSQHPPSSIVWHKVSAIPGPHLLQYVWWFLANHWQRRRDRRSGRVRPDLVYSPGINCLDADVIAVHIVFHAFYERVRPELALHRAPLQSWPLLIHRKLYYQLIMFLERRIYRDPGVRLVAVSSHVAAQLKSHFQREDVTVIRNGVDTQRFSAQARIAKRNESRKSYSYAENDFVLLLIGNDWKNKGLGALLRACALLTELPLRLLVVGSDDPILFWPLVEELRMQDRIRFEAPSSDVLLFYAAADVYVGPSLEDSFGLPILEAMACGLPVIASARAGVSEVIEDGSSGLILRQPEDSEGLAALLRRLYNDSSLQRELGETAAERAKGLSWEANSWKTLNFLQETARMRSLC